MINSRAIQTLMKSPQWNAIEEAKKEYLLTNFVESTAKRSTEFETIWDLAGKEGGKLHILSFFKWLEDQALNAE